MKIACISLGCPKNQVDLERDGAHPAFGRSRDGGRPGVKPMSFWSTPAALSRAPRPRPSRTFWRLCAYKQQNAGELKSHRHRLPGRALSQAEIEEEIPEVDAVVGCASNKAIDTIVARLFHGDEPSGERYGAK